MADTRNRVELAANAGSNGHYPSSNGIKLAGGRYQVIMRGDFNGAMATLTGGVGAFIDFAEGVYTAPDIDGELTVGKGLSVRMTLSGVSGSPSPSITCILVPIPADGEVR